MIRAHLLNLYGFYRDRLQGIQDTWFLWDSNNEPYKSYLKETVMPAHDAHIGSEYQDDLWATVLYYAYQEHPADYQLVDFTEGRHGKPNYDQIEQYLARKLCVVSWNSDLFIFRSGAFYKNSGEIEHELKLKLTQYGMGDRYLIKNKFGPVSEEIIKRLKSHNFVGEYPFNQRHDIIPVKNGAITRKPWKKLLPSSPVWGMTYALPVCYRENTKAQPPQSFMQSVVRPDDYDFLIQIPAQALLQDHEFQMSYLLVGGGANGKSTYLSFLRKFIGGDNCTAISIQDLCTSRFKPAELEGKLMNIYPDLPKKPVKNSGQFKALTGGDTIEVERKFHDPTRFRNKAVMVFSANELPEVDDNTYAWWRRWTVIKFPHTFPVNPAFECELITGDNLSAFLDLVITKMNEIEISGLKFSKSVDDIKEDWKRRANPVYGFMVENTTRDADRWIQKTEFYQRYTQWCSENSLVAANIQKFSDEAQRMGLIPGMKGEKAKRERVWLGIRWKTDVELQAEEGQCTLAGAGG